MEALGGGRKGLSDSGEGENQSKRKNGSAKVRKNIRPAATKRGKRNCVGGIFYHRKWWRKYGRFDAKRSCPGNNSGGKTKGTKKCLFREKSRTRRGGEPMP